MIYVTSRLGLDSVHPPLPLPVTDWSRHDGRRQSSTWGHKTEPAAEAGEDKTEAAGSLVLRSHHSCPGQRLPWLSNERKIGVPGLKLLILVFVKKVKHASGPTLWHAYGSYFSAPEDYCHEGWWAQCCAFAQFSKRTWKPGVSHTVWLLHIDNWFWCSAPTKPVRGPVLFLFHGLLWNQDFSRGQLK